MFYFFFLYAISKDILRSCHKKVLCIRPPLRCSILGTGSHYLAKIYRESYIQKRWVKCFYCSFSDNAPSRKWVTTMHCWCVSIRLATVYVSVIVYWLDVEKIIDDNHEQNWECHGYRHPHLYSFYWGRGKRKGEELYSLKKSFFIHSHELPIKNITNP